jgi:uncharacterized protein (DUF433 family)
MAAAAPLKSVFWMSGTERPRSRKIGQIALYIRPRCADNAFGQNWNLVMTFTRIVTDPAQMGGVPCIRGLRIPVATVVGMVADGVTDDEILKAYPDLAREDIREALHYAASAVRERELPLVKA